MTENKQQYCAMQTAKYFGAFTLTLTHFLAKTIFSKGSGGVHNISGNFGGVVKLLLCSKNGNSGEEGLT